MPVWRDSWRSDGSVVVIAPHGPSGGLIRQATVLLFTPRKSSQRVITLTDESGTRLQTALPETVLDGDLFAFDTCCLLRVQLLDAER